jgi:5-methylcytosine-specific restriction endonuclease McrA
MHGLAGSVREQVGLGPSQEPRAGSGRTPGDPLLLPVLVLNRLYQPVRITTVRSALRLLYAGSARALDQRGELHDFASWRRLPLREGLDQAIALVQGALRVPHVLHLERYSRLWRPLVRLTRRNLMLRDGYRCQYCGRHAAERALNIDHVLPRSRGGRQSWENLVTACQPCNRRKGERTPQEAGMPLLRTAAAPSWSIAAQLLLGAPAAYREWLPFLGEQAQSAS